MMQETTGQQPGQMAGEAQESAAPEVSATQQAGADAAQAEPSQEEIIARLEAEKAEAEARAQQHFERLQRTTAEFQNSRRRLEAQVNEETERANAALLMRLLPVLDDFALAFERIDQGGGAGDHTAWVGGFRQIQKKLNDILTDQGVTQVVTTGPFDPARHEAISSEPNEEVESGHIIAALRAGYEYKGRVLRPALVRVAS